MSFELHAELVAHRGATPEKLALVLHGVFGSSANWRLFMRGLAAERPEWGFLVCDLRGHGRSLGALPPHDLDAMADDLVRLAGAQNKPVAAVIGHSLGGKVALSYGLREPEELEQVWVLDSQPGARPFGGPTVEVLELLERLPRVFEDRNAFVEKVMTAGQSKAIAAWLAMNVRREDDELVLKLDLPAIRAILASYFDTDLWSALARGIRTHVVVGTDSFVWGEGDLERIDQLAAENASLEVHRLEGAGHWLNVDAPDALREIFIARL